MMFEQAEMSDVEHEHLQALVHRIATHIVEGSAAVHELKSTVARLKNKRSDIEYAVYEHWLKAAKTIEAAGKEKSSWEKFINSLRMSYKDGDDKEINVASPRYEKAAEEHSLLPIASRELWIHEAQNNVVRTSTSTSTRLVETVDHGYHDFGKKSESEHLDLSRERMKPPAYDTSFYDTEKLAQAAMTIGEPASYKTSWKGKRKLQEDAQEDASEGGGGDTKKKSFIRFTNGRKVGGEKVVELKKGGRCFYCERKGHRAKECKDNPDVQRKLAMTN